MNYYTLIFQYTTDKLIKSWSFWLLLLFLLCSFMSAIYQTKVQPEDYLYLYASLNLLANVSFGYIAGYIFYLVSDFFPSSRAEFDAMQKTMYAEYEILSTISVLGLYKLTLSDTESEQGYEAENQLFVEMICEKNPYEQCKDEGIRVMSYWQIRNCYVSLTRTFIKNGTTYFDILMNSQSKYLSYEEIESITKLKHCICLDYVDQKDGIFYARLFDINKAFDDYYFNYRFIKNQLKKKAKFCIDKKLKNYIEVI